MSTKGSQPRHKNRDDKKLKENWDKIDWSSPSSGKEVPKSELPAGLRTRIVYGKKQ